MVQDVDSLFNPQMNEDRLSSSDHMLLLIWLCSEQRVLVQLGTKNVACFSDERNR
jgi:hypothetical protein